MHWLMRRFAERTIELPARGLQIRVDPNAGGEAGFTLQGFGGAPRGFQRLGQRGRTGRGRIQFVEREPHFDRVAVRRTHRPCAGQDQRRAITAARIQVLEHALHAFARALKGAAAFDAAIHRHGVIENHDLGARGAAGGLMPLLLPFRDSPSRLFGDAGLIKEDWLHRRTRSRSCPGTTT